jgi:hypothetical protein
MADFDKLSDTKGTIINFIEEKARKLFYDGGTEYDFSSWVQAALLIEEIIIPCDYYIPGTLLDFVQEVISEAKSNDCKVERYQLKDGKKVNAKIWDYEEIIGKIDAWFNEERKYI